jgi:23S rRNA (adenine2030-N6)-methyltransferase
MNYRHAFHAGNFADVFKHIFLTRLLVYLARKDAPFRVIDTHAGEGAYDLSSDEARRSGEWRDGVARLAGVEMSAALRELLAPYLDIVGPLDAEGRPALYPGSPVIARRFMRADDRAIFCELRPDAYEALRARFARDKCVKALHMDGYMGLSAFVPPKERRGLVLIDPPFEQSGETRVMLDAFLNAYRKWPNGGYALWRPIKDLDETRMFYRDLAASGVRRILRLELFVAHVREGERLRRTGLVVVNPPYTFEQEARAILPFLSERLAQGDGAGYEIEWLAGE